MKKSIFFTVIVLGLFVILSVNVFAGETGHYVNGVEGIKAATIPPPGLYWRSYNVYYGSDTLKDNDGNKIDAGFDIDVYAFVNRLLWVSNSKILGGDYAADIIVPLIYTDIEISALGVNDDKFGIGDIAVEPFVLSWHAPAYDISCGLAIYIPTGEYDKNNPASAGKDFWTWMATLGGTYYFDHGKTWSASILSRYEIHSEKGECNLTPGNDFHFEWGIGKTLAEVWDVGITGYCHWQITDDSGCDAQNKDVHDKVFSAGPEITSFIPNAKLFISYRTQWEFDAEDRSEGTVTTLTFTKLF